MDIAIASGKGGTGKTTLAVNLASFLQENNTKSLHGIVLTDLDVEEPDSGLFLDRELLSEEKKFRKVPVWEDVNCTFCGICQSVCGFNAIVQLPQNILIFPELCHSCYACSELCPENALPMRDREIGVLRHYKQLNHFSGQGILSFIESILSIGEPSAVPLIAQTREYVKDNFPTESIRIFDCPPGTSCPLIESVKDADYVILVTEPTPFGLHDLRLAVETMKLLHREFGIVVNRDGIGNDDVIKYCLNEEIPILARIDNDQRIAEYYSRGALIYQDFPQFKEQLIRIIDQVIITNLILRNE